MLFNSFEFLIFFPAVCLIYFILRGNKWRIPFLLIASYYFYMNWKPAYAILILTSTIITYFSGILIEKHDEKRTQKTFLTISLVINFAILFVFKYFNFINESVFHLLDCCGLRWNVPNLDVLLPVGISFYTFQAVGYSIDVYRGSIKAERSFTTYALFVSFFPQLVAGPIERAKNLLPQFHEEHTFVYDDVIEGIKQMIWGFFMKLCIADILSQYVDAVYNNIAFHNGTSLIIATIFFTFQIYCDFGGYSNIAIGAARIMGFKLMENFHRPYLSLNINEFWKRWHISLSSWFKDYVYIPLGGNRVKQPRHMLNLMITFLVSGIWHGANWTFVVWGGLHGIYQVIAKIWNNHIGRISHKTIVYQLVSIAFCFILVSFAWIFFRANTVNDAFLIINKIFTESGKPFFDIMVFVYGITALLILIIKDLKDEMDCKINFMHSRFIIIRYLSTIALVAYILLFGSFASDQFIYFQF